MGLLAAGLLDRELAHVKVYLGLELSFVEALERQSKPIWVTHHLEQPSKVFTVVLYLLLLLDSLKLSDFRPCFFSQLEKSVAVQVPPHKPHFACA